MLGIASIYSVFQPLTDVFESVLKFFHNSGGIPWGWSIVLLTVAVRAVLVPLTLRQIKGMVRMQTFAPQLKEIQAKYKDDKQRQQQEMMKFYRENNINPLSSCLPLVLQLPVFFALYAMLRESLRTDICPAVQRAHNHGVLSIHHTVPCGDHGASFLFIHDLTDKATGITLIVLLILYVGSQLGSSVLMSSAAMEKSQRQIMMFMPIVFVAFIFRFPAGLLVYWITTNLWTVGQQYVVKRRIGAHQVAVGAAAPAGAGGSGGSGGRGALAGSTGGGNGGGSESGSGGGLGGMLRSRLRAAQETAEANQRAKSATATKSRGGSGNGAGNGDGDGAGDRAGARSETSGAQRSGGGSGSGGGGRSRRSGGSGASRSARSGKGGSSAGSGSGAGSGTASGDGGNGGSARAGSPPPRPPRKKKKRSGRRR